MAAANTSTGICGSVVARNPAINDEGNHDSCASGARACIVNILRIFFMLRRAPDARKV